MGRHGCARTWAAGVGAQKLSSYTPSSKNGELIVAALGLRMPVSLCRMHVVRGGILHVVDLSYFDSGIGSFLEYNKL